MRRKIVTILARVLRKRRLRGEQVVARADPSIVTLRTPRIREDINPEVVEEIFQEENRAEARKAVSLLGSQ